MPKSRREGQSWRKLADLGNSVLHGGFLLATSRTLSFPFCPSFFLSAIEFFSSWSRLEWLENDARSSKEKFEEISKGWSIDNQKLIAQELQEVLNNQQKLCSALVEDKKKLINDLQQVSIM